MEHLDPLSAAALVAAGLLVISLMAVRRRQRGGGGRSVRQDSIDTVAGWPPEAARILNVTERQAFELLKRALPGFMVLAQVPLSRFVRVPMRNSYSDWLQRVGQLSADLVICDIGSRVLAVVDIRSTEESPRSRRRHERMARVLHAAGIRVHVWREGDLPSASEVRTVIGAVLVDNAPRPTNSRPMPLIPVPEIAEIDQYLAEGDQFDYGAGMEPVASAFFDELETAKS
ncbi:MAG: DUF2726 domain-containing protein [Rubrivivax sp.]|nr:DUF2726 domain-containing protein [Rubrivivax sp.]